MKAHSQALLIFGTLTERDAGLMRRVTVNRKWEAAWDFEKVLSYNWRMRLFAGHGVLKKLNRL